MTKDIEAEQAAGRTVETPVVHAVNRQTLGSSSNPEQQEIAQIGQMVERIELRLRNESRKDHVANRSYSRNRELIHALLAAIEGNVNDGRPFAYDYFVSVKNNIPESESAAHELVDRILRVLPPF
ncbi:hypothetical protein [Rhodococcus sp. 14-2483-1-1]|uniref:hypothetical protein n=1 Tax=Rhodococcus sp. 14-2483-1-1 TaxID=2023148 RepID=UPI0011403847|nr:hypothetical protein [Rhodococcus sp. 14-2483-1-1]